MPQTCLSQGRTRMYLIARRREGSVGARGSENARLLTKVRACATRRELWATPPQRIDHGEVTHAGESHEAHGWMRGDVRLRDGDPHDYVFVAVDDDRWDLR